jgi:Spy/CpxP family protein refolding chaperone
MRITALVLAGALTVSVSALAVSTRAQQRAAQPSNPSDVKGLVFELANSMGMLRGLQQEDSILTLEQWAKGSMTVGGQRFDVPE